ncbi:MAG TPA: hypothetical protein VMT81_00825 [Candidatus Paceibacterota bacterium]|nr:hypothetical protein [Candidatus Paceibacterota bacterium]
MTTMGTLAECRFHASTEPKLLEVAQILKQRFSDYHLHVNYWNTLVEVGRRSMGSNGCYHEVCNYLISLNPDGSLRVNAIQFFPGDIQSKWSSTFEPSLTPAEVANGIPLRLPNMFD